MSSMLEQAIIDAEALREAALKSAQRHIEEKYSSEIKEAMKILLEPSEPGSELDVEVPLSAEDGESLCACPDEDEPILINIDFSELESAIDGEMGGESIPDPSLAPEEEELASLQEEIELDESLVDEYLDEGCPYNEEEEEKGDEPRSLCRIKRIGRSTGCSNQWSKDRMARRRRFSY